MRTSNVILATLAAAAVLSLSTTAEAARGRQAHNQATSRIDVAALPAYPLGNTAGTYGGKGAHARKAFGSHRRSTLDANGSPAPSHGLVTVQTAAGINITCSPGFASEAVSLIADAVANGIKFHRITCYSLARTHKSRSNHHAGNAFDSWPSIPAALVRQHGLRSGCDFHDCQHVDNAANVGGVAYWNSVRHGGTVTASADRRHRHHRRVRLAGRQASIVPTTMTFSARAAHRGHGHSDGCSRRGDAHGINCQLAKWVHCSGGAVRATSFDANSRRACPQVSGNIVADKHLPCGTPMTITNAANGRSVAAVVGDRGPGTIAVVDLSYRTAAAVGIKGSGCVYIGSGFREAGAQ